MCLTADLTAVRVKEAILLESKTIRKRENLGMFKIFPFGYSYTHCKAGRYFEEDSWRSSFIFFAASFCMLGKT